jgi:tripartite ATP-independent transporter DctM subunit
VTAALTVFLAAIAIGTPVAFALGFAGAAYVLLSGQVPIDVLPTILFGGMDAFPLLAIPFFIMAGDLLGRSGMLDRMIDLARSLVGPAPGGLAHVTIASSMLFGGVTGVSLADAAAIGRSMVPSMVREGYKPGVAAAVTASSSVMGAIIPPSVAMLIIAYIAGGNMSIGKLFLAGATPGVLIGLSLMATVALMAGPRGFPRSRDPWSLLRIGRETVRSLVGLVVPVVVVGGIVGGLFTPTEAGAVAVAYAILAGMLVMRSLTLRDIGASLLVSAKTSGLVFIMLAAAKLFAWILVINLVPQTIGGWIDPLVDSPQGFLLLVLLIFFLFGFVLEGVAIMIMLVPVLAPLAPQFGVEPHHLALVIVMSVQIGLLTPPVALGLFIVCPFAGCTISDAAREIGPFVLVILLVTIAVVFVPDIAMWLPTAAGY